MLHTIKRPEDIVAEITEELKGAFEADLTAVILYGSAASGHYVPGKSDINILVIVTAAGLDDLERAIPVFSRWRKRKVSLVFMTAAFVLASVDSFPVEFLTMKLNHRMLFGLDLLADLTFDRRDLRLQLERELKGKIFHLQQGFMDSEGKDKGLRNIIKHSLGAFVPLFKALLFLRGYEIPQGRRDVIKALSRAYPINPDIFLHCIDVREGKGKFSSSEIKQLFKSYQDEIARLVSMIDCMEL